MRPAWTRVRDEPTTTSVCMSATAGSNAASVLSDAAWPGRLASRTQPTGVPGGRCAASSSSARRSCQSRFLLAGL